LFFLFEENLMNDQVDQEIDRLETLLDAEKRRQYEADRLWKMLMALLSFRGAATSYINALERQLKNAPGQILPSQKDRYDHARGWLESRAKADHIKL
jgi:hypothetical protein